MKEWVAREQVRALLHIAETPGESVQVSAEVDERGWREGGPNDGVVYEVPTELVGQRVRIVPEGA